MVSDSDNNDVNLMYLTMYDDFDNADNGAGGLVVDDNDDDLMDI